MTVGLVLVTETPPDTLPEAETLRALDELTAVAAAHR